MTDIVSLDVPLSFWELDFLFLDDQVGSESVNFSLQCQPRAINVFLFSPLSSFLLNILGGGRTGNLQPARDLATT